jgi:CheY-like chemotaxis protein
MFPYPSTPHPRMRVLPDPLPPPSGQGKQILLADDETTLHSSLGPLLELQGYTVLHAANGTEAIRLAVAEAPSLILMDLMMPDMDGREAARALREDARTAHIPIIAITADVYGRTREGMLQDGFDSYLPKPFTAGQILREIERVLEAGSRR